MTNPNEPAYPRDHRHDGHNGLTKRELFAIQLHAAIVSAGDYRWEPERAAVDALLHADALIAELTKENDQ